MKFTLVVAFLAVLGQTLCSQSAIIPIGKTSGSDQGSISYSIGQVAYYPGDIVSEGIQQPYEFFNSVLVYGQDGISIPSIYPNPTEGLLTLELTQNLSGAENVKVFDTYGKMILVQNLYDRNSILDLKLQPSGIYYLKFFSLNKLTAILRVIKI